jgi:hypothetical protein
MPEISIRRAGKEDAPGVAALVATAFAPLKAVSWLLPEPSVRPRVMTADFLILVEHALQYGHIDLIDQDAARAPAAAVWFDRTAEVPEPESGRRAGQRAAPPPPRHARRRGHGGVPGGQQPRQPRPVPAARL